MMFFILYLGIAITNPMATVQPPPIPVSLVKAMKKTVVDVKQVACLAKNIFFEAGGEPLLGQAAVARVVLNRMHYGFAKTPCGVVYQSFEVDRADENGEIVPVKLCQFSWVCEGKSDPDKNHPRYKQAEKIAHDVLVNDAYNDVVPKSTLFFHNIFVSPSWAYRQVATIGNHIFYSKEKRAQ